MTHSPSPTLLPLSAGLWLWLWCIYASRAQTGFSAVIMTTMAFCLTYPLPSPPWGEWQRPFYFPLSIPISLHLKLSTSSHYRPITHPPLPSLSKMVTSMHPRGLCVNHCTEIKAARLMTRDNIQHMRDLDKQVIPCCYGLPSHFLPEHRTVRREPWSMCGVRQPCISNCNVYISPFRSPHSWPMGYMASSVAKRSVNT